VDYVIVLMVITWARKLAATLAEESKAAFNAVYEKHFTGVWLRHNISNKNPVRAHQTPASALGNLRIFMCLSHSLQSPTTLPVQLPLFYTTASVGLVFNGVK